MISKVPGASPQAVILSPFRAEILIIYFKIKKRILIKLFVFNMSLWTLR